MAARKRTMGHVLTVLLIAAGAVMLFAGIAAGEPRIVEMKAVRICLECIGIG